MVATIQMVGESLVEDVNLQAGERVFDVAAGNGNGNATLAAARHFADVTSCLHPTISNHRARCCTW
jgi:ubiquinone/menaquinone biosynthesis C-methylase UbiE